MSTNVKFARSGRIFSWQHRIGLRFLMKAASSAERWNVLLALQRIRKLLVVIIVCAVGSPYFVGDEAKLLSHITEP